MSKSVVYKLKPLICEIRWDEVNLLKIETQNAFEVLCGENN